jgi:hypothetical protein
MGACCATVKQEPLKNQQMRRTVVQTPTKDPQPRDPPSRQASVTKTKPNSEIKTPEGIQNEILPGVSAEKAQANDK